MSLDENMLLSQDTQAAKVYFLEALVINSEVCLDISNMRQQRKKWNCWSIIYLKEERRLTRRTI